MVGATSLNYLSLFLDEEVLNLLTNETNRYTYYTAQLLSTLLRSHSRLKDWENTSNEEIKLYVALIM